MKEDPLSRCLRVSSGQNRPFAVYPDVTCVTGFGDGASAAADMPAAVWMLDEGGKMLWAAELCLRDL